MAEGGCVPRRATPYAEGMQAVTRGEIVRLAVTGGVSLLWFLVPAEGAGAQGLLGVGPLATVLNAVAVIAALVAMRWRRAHPVVLAVALNLGFLLAPAVWPQAVWAYLSLCTHRRWPATIGVGALTVVTSTIETLTNTSIEVSTGSGGDPEPWVLLVASAGMSTLATLVVASIGSYLGARRAEHAALRAQLDAAARERALVEQRSRAEERNRIAREMHDVLGHQLTLISMHAGALAHRDDLTDDERRAAADTIGTSARDALHELRAILGQLRQSDGGAVEPPQPGLAELEALVEEHRGLGHEVDADVRLDGTPSQAIGRQAYRVVQEALTNAAKHAPGVPVRLDVHGGPDEGLRLRVSNPRSVAPGAGPGSQLGLIGLDERVRTVGGTFRAGPSGDGRFEVEVWMPW